MTKKLESIQATSADGIFILTYSDSDFCVEIVELAYGDLTPIVTVEYITRRYRTSPRCDFQISRYYIRGEMRKCAEELIDALPRSIGTKELEARLLGEDDDIATSHV